MPLPKSVQFLGGRRITMKLVTIATLIATFLVACDTARVEVPEAGLTVPSASASAVPVPVVSASAAVVVDSGPVVVVDASAPVVDAAVAVDASKK